MKLRFKPVCNALILLIILTGGERWSASPADSRQVLSSMLIAQGSPSPPTSPTTSLSDRGNCPLPSNSKTSLIAVKPLDNIMVTLSQSPTFYFYSPYSQGKYRFRLFNDAKKILLHSQDITITSVDGKSSAGIFAVSLPTVNAIKPEKYYFWELEYFCTAPNSSNLIVFGNLYRDRLMDDQQEDFIKAKTAMERIAFYQENGIWLELFDELVKALPESQNLWQQTLDAQNLQSISNQPIFPINTKP